MQFRGLRVRVQNGSATVRQVWRATIGVKVGNFTAAETVSWAGGGAGVYVSDDTVEIRFYRTAGPNPAVGNTLTGGTSGATATLASFPAENLVLTAPVAAYPAAFSTTGGTQGPIATNDEFAVVGGGQPIAKVSATIGSDTFDLTASWAGSTLTDVEAVVHRDRTVNFGWTLVKPGSRAPFVLLEEFSRQVDAWADGVSAGGGSPPDAYTPFTLQNNWANVAGRAAAAYAYAASDDMVQLKGYINRATGNATTGETIVSAGGLPSGRRPSERLDFAFEGERFAIHPNGSITFEGVGGMPPGPIGFNGLSFRADGS